jgi:hypothetical protein
VDGDAERRRTIGGMDDLFLGFFAQIIPDLATVVKL